MLNPHERDKRITFDAANHIYHIDGIQCNTSVTGVVAKFFPKFDIDGTIDRYHKRWQQNNHPKYGGKTKDEIKTIWEQDGEIGGKLGTRLHEAIETFYKGGTPFIDEVEADYALFESFLKDHQHLKPYRIEWRIGTEPDIGIAGTIDMCFTEDGLPTDTVDLIDWKRLKKEVAMVGFRGQMGFTPLSHIPDTNYFHYCIQLNLYKYILEKYYGLKVRNMAIVVMHRIHQRYIKCPIDDLQKEVADIFEKLRQNNRPGPQVITTVKGPYSDAKPQQTILNILNKNKISFDQFSEKCLEFSKKNYPEMLPTHTIKLRNDLLKTILGGSRIKYKLFKLIVEGILHEDIPKDIELLKELNHNLCINDLTGKVFGRLTVIEYLGNSTHGPVNWRCKCSNIINGIETCGNELIVSSNALSSGNTTSCGCYRKELTVAFNKQSKTVHGMGTVPEFKAWYHMIQRCTNEKHQSYKHYGERGIKVCDRWLASYENFLEDMGHRPEGRSLDRIDNDGNYCKANCRWATVAEQNDNKRRTLYFNDGVPVAQFIRENNLNYGQAIYYYDLKYSQSEILAKLKPI